MVVRPAKFLLSVLVTVHRCRCVSLEQHRVAIIQNWHAIFGKLMVQKRSCGSIRIRKVDDFESMIPIDPGF